MDYDIDTNPTEGFTTRWTNRDAYVQKASLVHTIHECAAARKWAWERGAPRWLWLEREERRNEDKNGNMVLITEWVAQIEVWGNYDVTDGHLIHAWDMKRSDIDSDVAPYPDWIGTVHGDGTSGDVVTIVCANKPHSAPPQVVVLRLPDEVAFRPLREEIQAGKALLRVIQCHPARTTSGCQPPCQGLTDPTPPYGASQPEPLPSLGCPAMSG